MILLYEYTTEKFDEDGNSLGFDSIPKLFPDTFFLTPTLTFDWDKYIVYYLGKGYYFGHLIEDLESLPSKEDWLTMEGNNIDVEYYNGVTAEYQQNPSGNIKNTKKLVYSTNSSVKFTILFQYDKLDRIVKMTSIESDKKEAESGTDYEEESVIQQDLTKLQTTPNYGVEVNEENNSIVVKKLNNCVIVTPFERTKPKYTDTLVISSKIAKINVSYTNEKWTLKVFAYKKDKTLISVVEAITDKQLSIFNTNKDIEYIALVFSHVDGKLPSSILECEPDKIGLNVEFKNFVTLKKHNTNSENNTETITVSQDDVIELENLSIPDIKFAGWFATENDTTAITSITMDVDKDVYARWNTTLIKHNIDNNGKNITEVTLKNQQIQLDKIECEGFVFDGWYLSDDTNNDTTAITSILMDSNNEVYARWEKGCVLTLHNKDNNNSEEKQTYRNGDKITLSRPQSVEGYIFAGWFETPNQYDESINVTDKEITMDKDFDFYARWEKGYVLTLHNKDNNNSIEKTTYTLSESVDLPTPEIDGYTFVGWYDSEDENATKIPSTITMSSDRELFARWEEN